MKPSFLSLNWGTALSSVTWAGPGWAMAAAPAVFLFGSAEHGGHRLAIWERQIWKGLCVVLSDKPAFVRTPNHQSEKTLISIFKTLLSSGFYTLLRCPLSASNSGAHDPVKSVKWCLGYSRLICLLNPLCHIQVKCFIIHFLYCCLIQWSNGEAAPYQISLCKDVHTWTAMSSHVLGWFGWCGRWRLWWLSGVDIVVIFP